MFHFSKVFGPESSQEKVYKDVAMDHVRGLLAQECNGLLFTFGVTNSGKTFTIHGSKEEPGILPRSLQTIFNSIRKTGPEDQRFPVDDANYKYAVVVSYLEIYNELIYDLLVDLDAQKEPLELKADSKGRIGVSRLRDVTVTTYDQALQILEQGRQARQVAETKLNTDSSRSHSIFTIKLCTVPKEHVVPMKVVQADPGKYVRYTKLSIVDLAGSERAKRTNNQGARLQEASSINLSLTTFKRCMDALRFNQMHPTRPSKNVPYRESKMTRLFQDYFSGQGKASMIVNVNPQAADYDETSRVMKFSAVAQDIKTVTSRIDTGRTCPKTKSRLNTEAFEGDPSLVGVSAPPPQPPVVAPVVAPSAKKAPPSPKSTRKPTTAAAAVAAPSQPTQVSKPRVEETVISEPLVVVQTDPALEREIERLRMELAESVAANVRLEASIREEVATEFAQEIFRNQLQCEERVVEIREALEEKYEKKIQILDSLNKTNMQRHAAKYQELVDEYNNLADEFESKELEMMQRHNALLSAKDSGSAAEYHDLIKQLEEDKRGLEIQLKDLTQRIGELEYGKQEWKKQVGYMTENRIAQLEREATELRDENKTLKQTVEKLQERLKTSIGEDKKRGVKNMWAGLKKKQRSVESMDEENHHLVAAAMNKDDSPDENGWANVSLEEEDQEKPEEKQKKKKFGSWRKRKVPLPATSGAVVAATTVSSSANPVGASSALARAEDDENNRNKEQLKKHRKQPSRIVDEVMNPAQELSQPKRQESDSMRLTDLLNVQANIPSAGIRTSPLLQKRSISKATAIGPVTSTEVPVIAPTKTNGRKKPASKYMF